jgi:hypothetical protein
MASGMVAGSDLQILEAETRRSIAQFTAEVQPEFRRLAAIFRGTNYRRIEGLLYDRIFELVNDFERYESTMERAPRKLQSLYTAFTTTGAKDMASVRAELSSLAADVRSRLDKATSKLPELRRLVGRLPAPPPPPPPPPPPRELTQREKEVLPELESLASRMYAMQQSLGVELPAHQKYLMDIWERIRMVPRYMSYIPEDKSTGIVNLNAKITRELDIILDPRRPGEAPAHMRELAAMQEDKVTPLDHKVYPMRVLVAKMQATFNRVAKPLESLDQMILDTLRMLNTRLTRDGLQLSQYLAGVLSEMEARHAGGRGGARKRRTTHRKRKQHRKTRSRR